MKVGCPLRGDKEVPKLSAMEGVSGKALLLSLIQRTLLTEPCTLLAGVSDDGGQKV